MPRGNELGERHRDTAEPERASVDTIEGPLTRSDVVDIYVRERESLFRMAYLVCGVEAEGQDAVHEAFARVLARPEMIRDPAKAVPYLRSIVLNLLRTAATRERSRRLIRTDDTAGPELVAAAGTGPSDEYEQKRRAALVEQALARLTLNQRTCVVLRYWMDLGDAAIAETTGMALGTVKTHLRRARTTLQRELERER